MVVQHNLTAMNSNRMLGLTSTTQAKSTEKLSSGYKINRAADDAAGLSISEKMRKQIRGLTQASLNAEDGISAVQTAEGALNEVQDMLQRMNELAVKAANGTMSTNDREYIQNEVDQLVTEIDRVSETTKFNETYLLKGDAGATVKGATFAYQDPQYQLYDKDGNKIAANALKNYFDVTFTNATPPAVSTLTLKTGVTGLYKMNSGSLVEIQTSNSSQTASYYAPATALTAKQMNVGALTLKLHVGADATANNQITIDISAMSAEGLGLKVDGTKLQVNGSDDTKALNAIDTIKEAIQQVSTQRSALGAVQNRLEHTIANLDNVVENTTAAESQIRDTDMASEMVKYSNNNILAQAGQAMLAQANQSNQGVLSLLR